MTLNLSLIQGLHFLLVAPSISLVRGTMLLPFINDFFLLFSFSRSLPMQSPPQNKLNLAWRDFFWAILLFSHCFCGSYLKFLICLPKENERKIRLTKRADEMRYTNILRYKRLLTYRKPFPLWIYVDTIDKAKYWIRPQIISVSKRNYSSYAHIVGKISGCFRNNFKSTPAIKERVWAQ